MKTKCGKKRMTFGEFITRVYDDCGERNAGQVVRFAFKSHLVGFLRDQRVVLA